MMAMDSVFNSWIDVINDETVWIRAEYLDLLDFVNVNLQRIHSDDFVAVNFDEWTNFDESDQFDQFGHFNVTESIPWSQCEESQDVFSFDLYTGIFVEILDDLKAQLQALELEMADLEARRNRFEYSSLSDSEWVTWFWRNANAMRFGTIYYVEYVPESHRRTDPLCTHYLEISASFQYPFLHKMAMAMNLSCIISFICYLWRYRFILRTLPHHGDSLVYWADLIHQWMSPTLLHLTTEWLDRGDEWHEFAVRRRLESVSDSQLRTEVVLSEMDMFPDGINRIIGKMLFHDLIREISVEKTTVTVLSEEWKLNPFIIREIVRFTFCARTNSIQIQYPQPIANRNFKSVRFTTLRTSMRRIRIVVAYTDYHYILPNHRLNGKSLAFDLESTGFVEPDYVVG